MVRSSVIVCFFFNDPATTEIYTLSLHDALPISLVQVAPGTAITPNVLHPKLPTEEPLSAALDARRSEEHTSELQSHSDLVCRLLLEKKKKNMVKNKNRSSRQGPA